MARGAEAPQKPTPQTELKTRGAQASEHGPVSLILLLMEVESLFENSGNGRVCTTLLYLDCPLKPSEQPLGVWAATAGGRASGDPDVHCTQGQSTFPCVCTETSANAKHSPRRGLSLRPLRLHSQFYELRAMSYPFSSFLLK